MKLIPVAGSALLAALVLAACSKKPAAGREARAGREGRSIGQPGCARTMVYEKMSALGDEPRGRAGRRATVPASPQRAARQATR